MRIKENKIKQKERLREICEEKGVNIEFMETLLGSVKDKKLLSKRNYHQDTIRDIINKSVK